MTKTTVSFRCPRCKNLNVHAEWKYTSYPSCLLCGESYIWSGSPMEKLNKYISVGSIDRLNALRKMYPYLERDL